MPAGRPLKFQTPDAMQAIADKYFADAIYADEPVTITGLALALDTSRETLQNYEERDEFFDTVKRMKLRVEHYAEKQLFVGKSAAGAIFALKNHGWRDDQNINLGNKDDKPFATSVTLTPEETYKRMIQGE